MERGRLEHRNNTSCFSPFGVGFPKQHLREDSIKPIWKQPQYQETLCTAHRQVIQTETAAAATTIVMDTHIVRVHSDARYVCIHTTGLSPEILVVDVELSAIQQVDEHLQAIGQDMLQQKVPRPHLSPCTLGPMLPSSKSTEGQDAEPVFFTILHVTEEQAVEQIASTYFNHTVENMEECIILMPAVLRASKQSSRCRDDLEYYMEQAGTRWGESKAPEGKTQLRNEIQEQLKISYMNQYQYIQWVDGNRQNLSGENLLIVSIQQALSDDESMANSSWKVDFDSQEKIAYIERNRKYFSLLCFSSIGNERANHYIRAVSNTTHRGLVRMYTQGKKIEDKLEK